MRVMKKNLLLVVVLLLFFNFGCDSDIKWFQWNMVEPGGESICGNGTPYRFFVNPSSTSDNVVLYFEAGGACWDYESCTGQSGIRGAANPNGIPETYMDGLAIPKLMSPFVFRNHPWDSVSTKTWTIIFIPYCTGDIHTGDIERTYEDPTGEAEDLEWHHAGHANIMEVLNWMTDGPFKSHFDNIPNLLVTGCSAGGAGAIINYHFIREELGDRVGQSHLLDDSGPLYYAEDLDEYPADLSELDAGEPHVYENYPHSLPLHRKIREAWGLDSLFDGGLVPPQVDRDNYGTIVDALSEEYPNDRLAHTQFTMDGNYSGYSYERFYPNDIDMNEDGADVIHDYWAEDQDYLMTLFDTLYSENGNMGYWIPYYRPFNDSHCTCVLSFDDTDITGTGMDMKDYIEDLIGSTGSMTNMRYYETPDPDELNKIYWGWELIDILMGAF